jgi:serine/threonine-protein kinase ATR
MPESDGPIWSKPGSRVSWFQVVLHCLVTNHRECFAVLDDVDRCKAISCLSRIPCAAGGTLIPSQGKGCSIMEAHCSVCEGTQLLDKKIILDARSQGISDEALLIFDKLVQSASFLDSRRPRVLAMFALRRFAVHEDTPSFLDLQVSLLGQWCMRSLKSSVRELRIAAG